MEESPDRPEAEWVAPKQAPRALPPEELAMQEEQRRLTEQRRKKAEEAAYRQKLLEKAKRRGPLK